VRGLAPDQGAHRSGWPSGRPSSSSVGGRQGIRPYPEWVHSPSGGTRARQRRQACLQLSVVAECQARRNERTLLGGPPCQLPVSPRGLVRPPPPVQSEDPAGRQAPGAATIRRSSTGRKGSRVRLRVDGCGELGRGRMKAGSDVRHPARERPSLLLSRRQTGTSAGGYGPRDPRAAARAHVRHAQRSVGSAPATEFGPSLRKTY
jgi:hypothetical protein